MGCAFEIENFLVTLAEGNWGPRWRKPAGAAKGEICFKEGGVREM